MSWRTDLPAPLSPYWAFVVHFATDTHLEIGQIRGRVEHVVSRHSTHFASLEECLAFMTQVLQEIREERKNV